MSSEDPRERDDLCGRELVVELPLEDLAEKYDPETWYEAGDGAHYCCREVWDKADDGRCIWHADVADKPADELAAARSEEPARLDRAVLRQSDLRFGVSLSKCRLRGADLGGADLFLTDLGGADLRDADLCGADLPFADLCGADLRDADLCGALLWDADLCGADLPFADLCGADLPFVDLGGADLQGADLGGADLVGADLGGALLWDADLGGAGLRDSRLTDAAFQNADLTDADLERADCTRANLFGADLTGAWLYGAVLANVQLNTDTAFGSHYTGDAAGPDKAAWTLRQLERLFRENALPGQARAAYLDRKDRRRQQYWAEAMEALRAHGPVTDRLRTVAGQAGQWARTALYGATMRYGESPRRVIGVSVLTVFVFGMVYPFFGGIDAGDEASHNYGFEPVVAGVDGLPGPAVDVLANLYFSAVTFTTLGYGDIEPATPVVELLASVESFVGALLMALLVFVLGRRATW